MGSRAFINDAAAGKVRAGLGMRPDEFPAEYSFLVTKTGNAHDDEARSGPGNSVARLRGSVPTLVQRRFPSPVAADLRKL